MSPEDFALLKLAFKAELAASEGTAPRLLQTADTARADALEAVGLMNKAQVQWHGQQLLGYVLTMRGRHEYLKAAHQD